MLTSSATSATPCDLVFLSSVQMRYKVDVRLVPHLVVGQAAAEDRRQDVIVLADLGDQAVERRLEARPGVGRS